LKEKKRKKRREREGNKFLFDLQKIECGVPLEVEEYVRSLHFGMMEVTYEWARQLPFREICDLTGIMHYVAKRGDIR
jgi:DSHCT (NUC185) domain